MSNLTEEVDEIANKTLEEFPELSEPSNWNVRIEEIVIFSTFLFDTVLCIFVIYLILRFKKLQTKTNVCIMNWLITTVLILSANPATYEFVMKLFGIIYIRYHLFLLNLFIVMTEGNIIFMSFLSFNLLFGKTKLRLLVAVAIVWFFLVIFFVLSYFKYFFFINTGYVLLGILCLSGLAIIFNLGCFVKHILAKTCTDDGKLRLTLVAYYFVSFILFIIFTVIAEHLNRGSVMNMVLIRLGVFIIIMLPTGIVILLIHLDKNFKLCFFQCGRRSHSYIESRIYYGNISESQINLQLSC